MKWPFLDFIYKDLPIFFRKHITETLVDTSTSAKKAALTKQFVVC